MLLELFMLACAGGAIRDASKGNWTGKKAYNKPRKNSGNGRKKSGRRYKENKSWLDAAWFHDHDYDI